MRWQVVLLVLGGCGPPKLDWDWENPGDSRVNTDDSAPPDDTAAPDDSDEPDDSAEPVEYDCDNLPEFNLGDATIEEARGYHGLVMDDEGHAIGWDGRNALVKATYDGDREAWLPGQRSAEQLARHPITGDIYMARPSEGAVVKITPDGATTTLITDLWGIYGVIIGPDENLYLANHDVHRLDLDTMELTLMAEAPNNGSWSAHSLGFGLDSTYLYIGTIGQGQVFRLPLDEDLNPAGELELFTRLPGGWLDAVGVDACGNLWVPDYYSSALFRITPDGEYQHMVRTDSRAYGHGLAWGSGIGGWRNDTLYMPQPYNNNRVREVIIGVPDGRFVRTWNGNPVPF